MDSKKIEQEYYVIENDGKMFGIEYEDGHCTVEGYIEPFSESEWTVGVPMAKVKKINDNYGELKEGQILVYKYNSVVVVHRIIKIVKDKDKYYFYTKGDANGSEDNYDIPEENVIVTTNVTLPYLGLPTVWLNEQ